MASIRVTHVIAGLEVGGAETMLCQLLRASDRERFQPAVISLSTLGPLAERIAALGVPVSAIEMRRGRVQPRPLARLAHRLRARRPDVVHTWMYHADLLGGAFARLTGDAKVVWGVHGSHDPKLSKRSSRITARACSIASRWVPHRIVSCSQRLAELHVRLGYDGTRMTVIPNGFQLDAFRPEERLRAAGRRRLGVGAEEPLVGILARYDPQKDYATFVRAAREIVRARPEVRVAMCGPRIDAANGELTGLLAEAGIAERCRLLGPIADPRPVLNALDVLICSSAFGEGFPMVLGEAMACGTPCVSTDVGDSALIVGDCGRVVAPRDWRGLARETLALLALPEPERAALGRRARARIEGNFALPDVARRFQELYAELAGVE